MFKIFNIKIITLYVQKVDLSGPMHNICHINVPVSFDFSLTVKAAPHECVIRTGQP